MKTPVSDYFDSIADDYDHRYDGSERPYHSYLHRKRLGIAVRDINFAGQRILDIGAGTGPVYNHITREVPDPDYFACDVSAEMLGMSRIPPHRRAVGDINEIAPPHAEFDLIFMLGVSTYISPEALKEVLTRVTALLAPKGRFIVSYTNPRCLDWHVRSLIRTVWRGKGVLGQAFQTYAYVPEVATPPLRLQDAQWYNASLTPFNTLLPSLSLWMAKLTDKHLPRALRSLCCADIVASYTK
jgi:ubiquinone/menaquinone biosynthesis C-methylase UbiE